MFMQAASRPETRSDEVTLSDSVLTPLVHRANTWQLKSLSRGVHMKSLALLTTIVFSFLSVVHASTSRMFNCEETEKSKKENGYDGTFAFRIVGKTLEFKVDRKHYGKKRGTALFDKEVKNQLRFIDEKAISSTSDFEASIFVNKLLLANGQGRITLSGNQANDGESGPARLWFVNAVMDCK